MNFEHNSQAFRGKLAGLLIPSRTIGSEEIVETTNMFLHFKRYGLDDRNVLPFVGLLVKYIEVLVKYTVRFQGNDKYFYEISYSINAILSVTNLLNLQIHLLGSLKEFTRIITTKHSNAPGIKEFLKLYSLLMDRVEPAVISRIANNHHKMYLSLYPLVKESCDIELQTATMITLIRLFKDDIGQTYLKRRLFNNDQRLSTAFEKLHTYGIFLGTRRFLNVLNDNSNSVFSIECQSIMLDRLQLVDLANPKNSQSIWLDFDLINQRMSCFCDKACQTHLRTQLLFYTEWLLLGFYARDVLKVNFVYADDTATAEISVSIKSSDVNMFTQWDFASIVTFKMSILESTKDFSKLVTLVLPNFFPNVFPSTSPILSQSEDQIYFQLTRYFDKQDGSSDITLTNIDRSKSSMSLMTPPSDTDLVFQAQVEQIEQFIFWCKISDLLWDPALNSQLLHTSRKISSVVQELPSGPYTYEPYSPGGRLSTVSLVDPALNSQLLHTSRKISSVVQESPSGPYTDEPYSPGGRLSTVSLDPALNSQLLHTSRKISSVVQELPSGPYTDEPYSPGGRLSTVSLDPALNSQLLHTSRKISSVVQELPSGPYTDEPYSPGGRLSTVSLDPALNSQLLHTSRKISSVVQELPSGPYTDEPYSPGGRLSTVSLEESVAVISSDDDNDDVHTKGETHRNIPTAENPERITSKRSGNKIARYMDPALNSQLLHTSRKISSVVQELPSGPYTDEPYSPGGRLSTVSLEESVAVISSDDDNDDVHTKGETHRNIPTAENPERITSKRSGNKIARYMDDPVVVISSDDDDGLTNGDTFRNIPGDENHRRISTVIILSRNNIARYKSVASTESPCATFTSQCEVVPLAENNNEIIEVLNSESERLEQEQNAPMKNVARLSSFVQTVSRSITPLSFTSSIVGRKRLTVSISDDEEDHRQRPEENNSRTDSVQYLEQNNNNNINNNNNNNIVPPFKVSHTGGIMTNAETESVQKISKHAKSDGSTNDKASIIRIVGTERSRSTKTIEAEKATVQQTEENVTESASSPAHQHLPEDDSVRSKVEIWLENQPLEKNPPRLDTNLDATSHSIISSGSGARQTTEAAKISQCKIPDVPTKISGQGIITHEKADKAPVRTYCNKRSPKNNEIGRENVELAAMATNYMRKMSKNIDLDPELISQKQQQNHMDIIDSSPLTKTRNQAGIRALSTTSSSPDEVASLRAPSEVIPLSELASKLKKTREIPKKSQISESHKDTKSSILAAKNAKPVVILDKLLPADINGNNAAVQDLNTTTTTTNTEKSQAFIRPESLSSQKESSVDGESSFGSLGKRDPAMPKLYPISLLHTRQRLLQRIREARKRGIAAKVDLTLTDNEDESEGSSTNIRRPSVPPGKDDPKKDCDDVISPKAATSRKFIPNSSIENLLDIVEETLWSAQKISTVKSAEENLHFASNNKKKDDSTTGAVRQTGNVQPIVGTSSVSLDDDDWSNHNDAALGVSSLDEPLSNINSMCNESSGPDENAEVDPGKCLEKSQLETPRKIPDSDKPVEQSLEQIERLSPGNKASAQTTDDDNLLSETSANQSVEEQVEAMFKDVDTRQTSSLLLTPLQTQEVLDVLQSNECQKEKLKKTKDCPSEEKKSDGNVIDEAEPKEPPPHKKADGRSSGKIVKLGDILQGSLSRPKVQPQPVTLAKQRHTYKEDVPNKEPPKPLSPPQEKSAGQSSGKIVNVDDLLQDNLLLQPEPQPKPAVIIAEQHHTDRLPSLANQSSSVSSVKTNDNEVFDALFAVGKSKHELIDKCTAKKRKPSEFEPDNNIDDGNKPAKKKKAAFHDSNTSREAGPITVSRNKSPAVFRQKIDDSDKNKEPKTKKPRHAKTKPRLKNKNEKPEIVVNKAQKSADDTLASTSTTKRQLYNPTDIFHLEMSIEEEFDRTSIPDQVDIVVEQGRKKKPTTRVAPKKLNVGVKNKKGGKGCDEDLMQMFARRQERLKNIAAATTSEPTAEKTNSTSLLFRKSVKEMRGSSQSSMESFGTAAQAISSVPSKIPNKSKTTAGRCLNNKAKDKAHKYPPTLSPVVTMKNNILENIVLQPANPSIITSREDEDEVRSKPKWSRPAKALRFALRTAVEMYECLRVDYPAEIIPEVESIPGAIDIIKKVYKA